MSDTYPTIIRFVQVCWPSLLRPRHILLFFISVILGLFAGSVLSTTAAAAEDAAIGQFQAFAASSVTRLSQVKSYIMQGEFKVTIEDEVGKVNGKSREDRYKFVIWGQNGAIKERVETLDPAGQPVATATYFLDAKRVIVIDEAITSTQRMAKIFPLGPHAGLINVCPAFLEYSFLQVVPQYSGIPATIPSDLGAAEKWAVVARSFQSAAIDPDGLPAIRLASPAGSTAITLRPPPGAGAAPQIKSLQFLNEDGGLHRKIEVVDYLNDEKLGAIGRSFKVTVYNPGSVQRILATWDMEIKDLRLNSPIDEELFSFDPSSVDMIYDGATEQTIRVPK